MSEIRKILGTSFFSLVLVIVGLFMVCSGRVPEVNYDDEFATEGDYNGNYDSDLMNQLAVLDDESTKLEDHQRSEILAALGIDAGSAGLINGSEKDFLTEELFLDLEVEIADMEKRSDNKGSTIDSLKLELQEADLRLAALGEIVEGPTDQFAGKDPVYPYSNGVNGDYNSGYQEALDAVYDRRYSQAISKFRGLLRSSTSQDLADNCQYWIGESYYALGNFELAISEFERVYVFDNSNKADDAQFMMGKAYLKLGNPNLAEFELGNLMNFYQSSEYFVRAERELNDLSI